MLDTLKTCLGLGQDTRNATRLPPQDCIFCNVTKERGFNVVYEDEDYTVFKDRSPGAKLHLLCVPTKHVDNVKTLSKTDVPMLREMQAIGTQLLDRHEFLSDMHRLGFHIPPFFSVNHLHLHVLGLPCASAIDRIKYRPSTISASSTSTRAKGFSHFVSVQQAVRILERDGKVRVWPC